MTTLHLRAGRAAEEVRSVRASKGEEAHSKGVCVWTGRTTAFASYHATPVDDACVSVQVGSAPAHQHLGQATRIGGAAGGIPAADLPEMRTAPPATPCRCCSPCSCPAPSIPRLTTSFVWPTQPTYDPMLASQHCPPHRSLHGLAPSFPEAPPSQDAPTVAQAPPVLLRHTTTTHPPPPKMLLQSVHLACPPSHDHVAPPGWCLPATAAAWQLGRRPHPYLAQHTRSPGGARAGPARKGALPLQHDGVWRHCIQADQVLGWGHLGIEVPSMPLHGQVCLHRGGPRTQPPSHQPGAGCGSSGGCIVQLPRSRSPRA
jgi:hypothetical protein